MPQVSFGLEMQKMGEPPEVWQPFEQVILPFEPMDHQWDGFYRSRSNARSGLFFEPRTGKTLVLQMLAIFFARYGSGTIQIMPPALFRQFQHDYGLIKGHGLKVEVLNQGPAGRKTLLNKWTDQHHLRPQVVLVSKEIFKVVWQDLYLLGFTNTHFDESHLGLQNHDSQIAKALRAFINQHDGNRLVLSTGTPLPNQIRNGFATLNLLYPEIYRTQGAFDSTHVTFKKIWIPDPRRPGETRTIQVVDSYYNLEYLSQVLYWHAVWASKLQVLNLETPNVQIIECDLSTPHRKLYHKVMNERLLEVDGEIIDARAAQKLRQVALQIISVPEQFEDNFDPNNNSVYSTVEALLDSINTDKEKVVLFSNYVRTVDSLEHRFKSLHPAKVYGPNGPARNALEIERFHEQDSCRILIAHPAAGGVGAKLGDVATTLIFVEPVSTPGLFDQCLSRIMLIGQKEPVVCYIVNVRGTISPLATENMLKKVPNINSVMGTKRSLFDALLGKPIDYAAGPYELTDDIEDADWEELALAA